LLEAEKLRIQWCFLHRISDELVFNMIFFSSYEKLKLLSLIQAQISFSFIQCIIKLIKKRIERQTIAELKPKDLRDFFNQELDKLLVDFTLPVKQNRARHSGCQRSCRSFN